MRSITRAAGVGLLAAGFVILTAPAGWAIDTLRSWNSSTTPLTASGYGSTGYGYGQWKVSTGTDGTKSRLYANIKLNNADNHTVYAKLKTQSNAGSCFAPDYTSCVATWYHYASSDSSHYNGSVYKQYVTRTDVNPSGDYARAIVNVCLDIPWRSDIYSGDSYTKGDWY